VTHVDPPKPVTPTAAEAKTETKQLTALERAMVIGKALKAHDEAHLVKTMSSQSPEEMHAVSLAYKGEYLRDLTHDLSVGLKQCHLQTALMALSMNGVDYDAQLVREGVRGWGTNEHLLTEILCTRTPEQLAHISGRYHTIYSRNMLEDIKDDTSGYLKTVYVELLTAKRTRVGNVDDDVEALFRAGEDKWGTDEAKFIEIICHSTRAHCEAIFHAYKAKHKKSLDDIIHDEMGGLVMTSTGHAGRALAILVTPLDVVFSTKFHKYCHPWDPKHANDLIRICVTQRGQGGHLKAAGQHFLSKYGQSMSSLVGPQGVGHHYACILTILQSEGC